MLQSGAGKLMGTKACGLHRLRNKTVDKLKLGFGDLHIHSAQNIDSVCHRLPAKGDILCNIQIQILIHGLQRLFRTAVGISRVEFPIRIAVINVQISIPVQRYQFDLSRILIDAADNIHIRLIPRSHIRTSAVHTKHGNHAVTLHLLDIIHRQLLILDIFRVEILPLDHIPPSGHISITEDKHERKTLRHNHGYDAPPSLPLLCPLDLGFGKQFSGIPLHIRMF